jgi:ADP-heptose:LPS heptosyltransferase
MTRLVARLDNVGDVLLAGPAVRAVAASGEPVIFLAGPAGAPAARMLPGVAEVLTFSAPWVSFDPPAVDSGAIDALLGEVRAADVDEAIILTSFHQSPLPLALLLRLAGVRRIAATCVDYPGSLLDVRHPYLADLHEVEQALSLCQAAGHHLPDGDDASLQIRLPHRIAGTAPSCPYIVVHPGASVEARQIPVGTAAETVAALVDAGRHVVVTGSADEVALANGVAAVAHSDRVTVAAGDTDLAQFAHLLRGADAVVCGNTGTAHLAAAVGTPVVEAFAPVVPAHRWRPWMVPHELIGRLDIGCAGCRSRRCPLDDQPCLRPVTADAVLDAVDRLASRRMPAA